MFSIMIKFTCYTVHHNVMGINEENEIGKPNSNSGRVCRVQFALISFRKCMNPSPQPHVIRTSCALYRWFVSSLGEQQL